MANRLSLYFEPYAWEKLNRVLSYLLLSGKPFYELPSMNDLIEGIVVFTSRKIEGDARSKEKFITFISGDMSIKGNSTRSEGVLEKGRIAFNFTTRSQDALLSIRNSISDAMPGANVSDPMLIRSCVYFTLISEQNSWEFPAQTYILFLYNLRPGILSFNIDNFAKEIAYFTVSERQNLRKVVWDESAITELNRDHYYFLPDHVEQGMFRIGEKSKGFAFNYPAAYLGFQYMMLALLSNMSLPELFFVLEEELERPTFFTPFKKYLNTIYGIAKKFNLSSFDISDPQSK